MQIIVFPALIFPFLLIIHWISLTIISKPKEQLLSYGISPLFFPLPPLLPPHLHKHPYWLTSTYRYHPHSILSTTPFFCYNLHSTSLYLFQFTFFHSLGNTSTSTKTACSTHYVPKVDNVKKEMKEEWKRFIARRSRYQRRIDLWDKEKQQGWR